MSVFGTAAQYRQAQREAEQKAKFVAAFTGCVLVLAALPIQAWLLMLVIGAVHGMFAVVPAVGFGTAVLLVVGLNMLTGLVRRAFRK
jgi:hypothetical protein